MQMTMTTPSGVIATLSPKVLRPYMRLQRPLIQHQIDKLVKNWQWSQAQILTVHAWNPHIIKYLTKPEIRRLEFDPDTAYHVSNGDHRLAVVYILFGPDFVYTADHEARGLIPKGCYVGSPVLMTCQISEEDPVDTFIRQNAGIKVTAANKFVIQMHRGDEAENSLYALLTRQYGIRVEFDSGPVGGKKNTTAACHSLLPAWKANRARVGKALDIICSIYKDNDIIDPSALSEGFMTGLINTLTTCGRMFDDSTVVKALKKCRAKGWSAFTIARFCQSTGGRAISSKTRALLLHLVTTCIKTGQPPSPTDINIDEL
jgi:hypothetical protein